MKKRTGMKKSLRGSVSVFLAILLTPMLTFGGAAVDIATIAAARSMAESSCASAVNGILSEYDRTLYERYGLFAVSGTREDSELTACSLLSEMTDPTSVLDRQDLYTMRKNAEYGGKDRFRSFLQLQATDFSVEPVYASSPANPAVLKNQILSFMKYRGPLVLGENLLERFHILDTLETQARTTSAKLRHDASMAAAEEAARDLYTALQTYFGTMNHPVFLPDAAEGIRNVCERLRMLTESRLRAETAAEVLNRLHEPSDAGAPPDASAGEAELQFWATGTGAEKREELLRTLPRRISARTVVLRENPDAAEAVHASEDCAALADLFSENIPEIREIRSSAAAFLAWEAALSDAERKAFSDTGTDLSVARQDAGNYCDTADYFLNLLRRTAAETEAVREVCTGLREETESAYREAIEKAAAAANAVVTAADALLGQIRSYEAEASLYEELLYSLEDGDFKNNLTEEYAEYRAVFRPSAAESLRKRAENTARLLENAGEVPAERTAALFSGQTLLTKDCVCEDSETGQFLRALEEKYSGAKENGDSGFLDGLKKYVASQTDSNADSEEKPTRFSEADLKNCFDWMDALTEGNAAANTAALKAFSVSGENSSDAEISGETSRGLDALSGLLSGFGSVIGEIGDGILVLEYLTEMFSCATDKAQQAVSLTGGSLAASPFFGYELEYLIYGNDTASLNRAAAIAEISALRFALNTVYVYTDAKTKAAALTAATAAAGWTGFGVPIVQNVILICWSLAETAVDMHRLLDGETVAVVKTESSWFLSFEGLTRAVAGLSNPDGDRDTSFTETLNGFSYRDYLTLFLTVRYSAGESSVLNRCAKLIQINMNAADASFSIIRCWTVAYCKCAVSVRLFFCGSLFFPKSAAGKETDNRDAPGKDSYEICIRQTAAF